MVNKILLFVVASAAAISGGAAYAGTGMRDVYTDGASVMGPRDPYTDGGKAAKFDVYSDGTRVTDRRDVFSDGSRVTDKRDVFTDGAKITNRDGFIE